MDNIAPWLGLLIPLLLFILIGTSSRKTASKSPIDFLYGLTKPDNSTFSLLSSPKFRRYIRVASLAATNLSVISSILYLVDGGAKHGFLILFIPIAVLVGYFWLRKVLSEANADGNLLSANTGGMIISINKGASTIGNESIFAVSLTTCWIIIYILFAFYELVICAKLITPMFNIQHTGFTEFILASLIFITGLIYSQLGGVRSVMSTDYIQLVFGTAFVIFLVSWPMISQSKSIDIETMSHLPDSTSVFFIVSAIIGAIATQFYNPYNWHSCSVIVDNSYTGQQNQQENNNVLKYGAILTFIILLALGLCGIVIAGDNYPAPTFSLLGSIAQSATPFWKFVTVAGLISLTISTLDSLMIALASNFYQSFLKRDISNQRSSDIDILRIRLFLMMLYLAGFIVLTFFYVLVPPQKAIDVLLTIVSGVIVLFPFLLLSVSLYKTKYLHVLTNSVITTYLYLFGLSWVFSTCALFFRPSLYDKIPLLFLFIASSFAIYIFYTKNNSSKSVSR